MIEAQATAQQQAQQAQLQALLATRPAPRLRDLIFTEQLDGWQDMQKAEQFGRDQVAQTLEQVVDGCAHLASVACSAATEAESRMLDLEQFVEALQGMLRSLESISDSHTGRLDAQRDLLGIQARNEQATEARVATLEAQQALLVEQLAQGQARAEIVDRALGRQLRRGADQHRRIVALEAQRAAQAPLLQRVDALETTIEKMRGLLARTNTRMQ